MPSGSYSYTARGTENLNAASTSAAVSVIVNTLPSVSVTAPAANTQFDAPATVNVSTAASDPDGTIAQVRFYANATLARS